MDFEVKTGVPIPDIGGSLGRKRGRGKWQLLINSMAVGDCVDVPEDRYNSMYVAASRMGIKLKSRRDEAGIVRIWRVSE